MKIVVIGGGTGSSIVLKGLKNLGQELYALVPMGDSGGSTGRLREEFGVLSSGEIRQRLIALSSDEKDSQTLAELMDYRFKNGDGLKGHNFGNIMLSALTKKYESQAKAIEIISSILKIKGEIVPTTLEKFDLVAEYADGEKIVGEHQIDENREKKRITNFYTLPKIEANPRALEVIKQADLIIFAMGNLYTSVIHNLSVEGVAEALSRSSAKKIYVSNLMTSSGETDNLTLGGHISELEKYAKTQINEVIVNSAEIPLDTLKEYEKNLEYPLNLELTAEQKNRIKIISADVLSEEIYKKSSSDMLRRSLLRHDPEKLSRVITSRL